MPFSFTRWQLLFEFLEEIFFEGPVFFDLYVLLLQTFNRET